MNAAGLRSKISTFKKVIKELQPSVFFIQETKLKEEGKIRIEDYIIFEKLRNTRKNGGGLAIGCKQEFNPIWVREGEASVETLSINIFLKNMKIRCCTGYGCQEGEIKEQKEEFWNYLDTEVIEAKKEGAGLIIQMDGNLWAGDAIVKNDPRSQNSNGILFKNFLNRNPHLTVVNNLSLCEGLITRERRRKDIIEKSILDFFIVCDLVLPFVKRMVIDEDKKYVLTNYENVKKGGKANNTDHNTEYLDLDIKANVQKPVRTEIWNFKCEKSQEIFKKETSDTNEFTRCFQNELPIFKQIEDWKKVLTRKIQCSFKKVRIKNNQKISIHPEISALIDKRNKLQKNCGENSEIGKLETAISEMEAEINRNKIMKHFKSYSENPESVNLNQVWKTLKKLCPKARTKIPIAKKNRRGKIISEPNKLKQLLAKEYKFRLRARPSRPDLNNLKNRKKKIFQFKLKIASENKSRLWTQSDLDEALKSLKTNRSRDPEGMVNEIFKQKVVGSDLKSSLLIMFNKLKEEQKIPPFMSNANITTIPKKGSRLLLENERGIFRVPVLRSILMRLIYNQKYESVDSNMSDCQMGARKRKGCRNNILIINGIIHDIIATKKNNPVILQIYDYRQMFDAINLEEAVSDAFDAGIQDDNLNLIYKANKDVQMAVNTPSGLTKRENLSNVILQGDVWSSLLASIQVDQICKEIESTGYGYKYMDILPISMLALVDDLIGITYAGYKAQQMNIAINIKTAEKRLQFGVSKCKTMVIGKDADKTIKNPLMVDQWRVDNDILTENDEEISEEYAGEVIMEHTEQQKYLGFILSSKGDNMKNINEMKNKSIWITNTIFDKMKTLNLGKYYFESALILLKVILRSSILFASETYYNLKETEIRTLERIEESFLRKLFKTTTGCPISQLYLETGHYPARFEVFRRRLLFLQNILKEKSDSLILKFVTLQLENPRKGDWASSCIQALKYLNIELSIDDIKLMRKSQFRNILKSSINKKALEYLLAKRGSKGAEISYSSLKMQEYLLPQRIENLSISEKQYIFAIRNRMIQIDFNFKNGKSEKLCICGEIEDMMHIYTCNILNPEKAKIPFDKIFENDVRKHKIIQERFKNNIERSLQGILFVDPLCNDNYAVMDI